MRALSIVSDCVSCTPPALCDRSIAISRPRPLVMVSVASSSMCATPIRDVLVNDETVPERSAKAVALPSQPRTLAASSPLLVTLPTDAPASMRTPKAESVFSVKTSPRIVPVLTSCGVMAPEPICMPVALASKARDVMEPPLKIPPRTVVVWVASAEPAIFTAVDEKPVLTPLAMIEPRFIRP